MNKMFPTLVKVLVNAELVEDCKNHPTESLQDKSVIRIIEAQVDGCFIVETNTINPAATALAPAVENFYTTVEAIKPPTQIEIKMSGYSIQAELHVDGNMFGVLACGDLQSGVAAFGPTIESAVNAFKMSVLGESPKTLDRSK